MRIYTIHRLFIYQLLWSILLFLLTKYFIGNYYEVYEFIHPATLCGKLMDGYPANIIYPIANVGLSGFYIWLYSLTPNFPWYDCVMALTIIISTAVIFNAIHFTFREKTNTWAIVLFNTALFFLFIADQIVNWNITRGAFIACIAAFVWFALKILPQKLSRNTFLPLILIGLLFTLGTMIRPETGELILLLALGYLFFCHSFEKEVWLKSLALFIPALLIVGYVAYHRHASSEFYMQLEPSTEYQISIGNTIGIDEMKTTEDSMKYVALKAGIINDPSKISYAFVKRVTGNKSMFVFSSTNFYRAINILQQNIQNSYPLFLFSIMLLFIGLIFLLNKPLALAHYLLFHLFFWSILFGITYFMIMESRLFSPLLFFNAMASIIFLWQNNFTPIATSRKWVAYGVLLLLLFSTSQLVSLHHVQQKYQADINANHIVYEQLKKQAANKILAPDASAFMVIFFNNFLPFQTPDFSIFKKIFLIDLEALSLRPSYRNFLDHNCHCNSTNLGEFYDYLYAHKQEVAFAGNAERFKLFETYLQMVHHRNYRFHTVASLPNGATRETNGLSIFELE